MKIFCTIVTLVNLTTYPWDSSDIKTLNKSAKTCKTRYKSCLKKFIKDGKKDYRALCK